MMQWPSLSRSARDDTTIIADRRGPKLPDVAAAFLTRPSSVSSSTSSSPTSPPPPYEAIHFLSQPVSQCIPGFVPTPSANGRQSRRHESSALSMTRYNIGHPPSGRSSTPGVSIPHLREALDSLDTQMASLLNQRHELESHLEQVVRSQSPIYRIPEELLSSIFVAGVCNMGEEDPLLVATLMLVCRYWRDVAIDTPELWADICVSPHDSLEKAHRKLARSKSVLLDITINFTPRVDNSSGAMESVIHAMDLIRPALWRARSFRLSVPNKPQAHAALLRCREEAPYLESLCIRVFHSMQEDHYSSPCLPLFKGHTPRLRSCSFTSFNFNWDRRVVSNLRVLQLGGYWNGSSPSVGTLLDILRGCPGLEELALRNMSDVDPETCVSLEHEFISTKVVKLPRLTKASFYYAGIMRTRMLLSQISFPALESLDFCYLDNLTPVLEHLRQQSLTSLPLKFLRIESSFLNEPKFIMLLRRLTSLVTLELVDVEDVTCFLLRNLSSPPVAHPWVCPKLDRLNLDGCTALEWDALRGLVESRLSGRPPQLSSASAAAASRSSFVSTASASAHIHALSLSRPATPTIQPRRLSSIDVTRCHQISKEMVQWLKMYVRDVRCEPAKGIWGESILP